MTVRELPDKVTAQPPIPEGVRKILRGGSAGNARLTSLAGLIIFVLLAAEGFTLLSLRALITPHAFIGLLLVPIIGLKLVSVGYRFISYYAGVSSYRAGGPPHPLPRVLAPFLVICTLVLFVSGVILLVTPPGAGDTWLTIHQSSFFAWFAFMSAHVLTHVLRAFELGRADMANGKQQVAGAFGRRTLVTGSIILGIVLAIVFLPWDSTWAHWLGTFRGH